MTILAAMQSASIRLLGRRPATFFGAAAGLVFELELTDLINEVANDIVRSHDWQALTKIHTVTADGVSDVFSMPEDYDRMLVTAEMSEPAGWFWNYRHFTDINDFLYWHERGFTGSPGGWILYGDELRFSPAPSHNAQFPYISTGFARDSASLATKARFDADSDEFLLPERLLTLGIVWRWRENKKLDFTGDQEAFMKALGEYAAKDKGARAYRRNSRATFPGTYPAWPGTLG